MTSPISVVNADADAVETAVGTLTLAFASDPLARWVLPASRTFLDGFEEIARIHASRSLAGGGLTRTTDGFGAAVWFPPGGASDSEALLTVLERLLAPDERRRVFSLFDQMERSHPQGDHWYLRLIGVDPVARGRGHGSSLLRHTLERCDAERLPAYLEATSERSAALYERHGFERTGRIQVGDSPAIWPMLRSARAGG